MMKDHSHRSAHRTRQNKEHPADSPAKLALAVAKSVMISCGIGLGLLLVFSLILYFTPDPASLIPVAGLISAALTALLCGFFAARLHGKNHAVSALIAGMVLMGLFMLISFLFAKQTSGYSALISMLAHAGFLLMAVLGGILASRRRPVKKKRRH